MYTQPLTISACTGMKAGSEEFLPNFNPQDYFTPQMFDEFRTGGKGYGVLVAEVDGKVAGICCFIKETIVDYATGDEEDSPYVELLAVNEENRGQGIGSKLLAGFQDRMKADGFKGVSLDVMKNNTGAAELYKRLGYETIHTTQDLIVEGKAQKPSAPNLQVAFATAADWNDLSKIQASVTLPAGHRIKRFFDESVRGEMDQAQFLKTVSTPGRSIFIVRDNGNPVGYAETQVRNSASADRKPKRLCVIHRLVSGAGPVQDALLDTVEKSRHCQSMPGCPHLQP